MRFRRAILLAAPALLALALGCGGEAPGQEYGDPVPAAVNSDLTLIPERTVVLTFDDASRTHLETVAPLLKEYGFGATFFITAAWMNDPKNYMTWAEVAELHRMGFEIGNHTWSHPRCNSRRARDYMPQEVAKVEAALAEVGVPKPVSFAWPGGYFGPEGLEELEELGYRLGRRTMFPESPIINGLRWECPTTLSATTPS